MKVSRGPKVEDVLAPKVGGVFYHIRLKKGDLPRYILLPGDPARVKTIVAGWDKSQLMANHREYLAYKGLYKGTEISSMSTGMGSGAIGIAVEELVRIGVDTLIRTGTTGTLDENIDVGDLVISTGSVRADGATKCYARPEYPAVANYEVVLALIEAAERLNTPYHVGLTYSTDSFYLGEGRPGANGFMSGYSKKLIEELKALGVLNMEMEASTLFTLASIYRVRAGTVCAGATNRILGKSGYNAGVDNMVKVANEAVHILDGWDRRKKEKGKRYFYPSL